MSCVALVVPTAGLPPGIYEELHCTASDIIDWPSSCRDGYSESSVGAVPNAYIAHAADRLSKVAGWLRKPDDQVCHTNIDLRQLQHEHKNRKR